MPQPNLNDASVRAAAFEHEKQVLKIKKEARLAVSREHTGPVPTLVALSAADLATTKFPDRQPLLYRGDGVVFREGHIGQANAMRGFGKTWLVYTLAYVASHGVDALGFRNPEPCRVLIIDGEMAAEEIQERVANLRRMLRVPAHTTGELTIIAADWQNEFLPRLDTLEGQAAIEPHVENADFIILDNRSSLLDPEGEKDPTAWQPAQDYLLSLRRRGKAVLLAHHSNRMGGARGISKAEDPMNLLLNLTRPDDYTQDQGARFTVTFDKARGIYGAAAAPFTAALTPTGWRVEAAARADGLAEKILRFLATTAHLGERPKTATAVVRGAGVNRAAGLEALAELVRTGAVARVDGAYALADVPHVPNHAGEDL